LPRMTKKLSVLQLDSKQLLWSTNILPTVIRETYYRWVFYLRCIWMKICLSWHLGYLWIIHDRLLSGKIRSNLQAVCKKEKIKFVNSRKEIKSNPIIASFENYLTSSIKHITRISKWKSPIRKTRDLAL
jgi:hypothetical protein